jgi:hypothetical protein
MSFSSLPSGSPASCAQAGIASADASAIADMAAMPRRWFNFMFKTSLYQVARIPRARPMARRFPGKLSFCFR